MQPKISVLVPVYNTEKYLRECLESILNQTFKDIEIICVNDGSSDDSPRILWEYAKKDCRLKIVDKKRNEGLLLARKTAVLESKGKYICFVDSDDYFARLDALKIMFDYIEESSVDILQFNVNLYSSEKKKIVDITNEWFAVYDETINGSYEIIEQCIKGKYSWNLWNKIYRTEICKNAYKLIRDVNMVLGEDLYAYFIISYKSNKFKGVDSLSLYTYRVDTGVTSKILSVKGFEDYVYEINIIDWIKKILIKNKDFDRYEKIINALYNRILDNIIKRFENIDSNYIKEAFNVFCFRFDGNILRKRYSWMKYYKYKILSMIGIRKYLVKYDVQKKYRLLR
jgi:glycosyltransferase involved in cell wall biosynthesis